MNGSQYSTATLSKARNKIANLMLGRGAMI